MSIDAMDYRNLNNANIPWEPITTDMENKLIADTLSGFRDLILHSAEKVDNIASTGQAGYNSMAVEIMMHGLVCVNVLLAHSSFRDRILTCSCYQVKSTEDLLALTRRLRELWVVGPLKKPGDGGEAEVLDGMKQDAASIFELLNRMRAEERQKVARESNGCMTYVSDAIEGIPARAPDNITSGIQNQPNM